MTIGVSVLTGPDGALIGRDRTGAVLAVIAVDHLTPDQRTDLAAIYRLLAATIQETLMTTPDDAVMVRMHAEDEIVTITTTPYVEQQHLDQINATWEDQ